MCDSLWRRLSAKDVLLLGSVSVDGFRAANLSRQSARYRSLPPFDAGQVVPHGISRQGGALHSRRCQRVTRLANLCRFCPSADWNCATVACPRSYGRGSGAQSIRAGLDHHRSLSIAFSMGPVSPAQSCREDAHVARPARQYSHVYPRYRRQSARRQHPRRDHSRSRRVYVMDRGYVDFDRLYFFTLCSAFFVLRTKENVLLQRRYSHPVDHSTGVRSDHTVILTAIESVKVYPDALRRVSYLDTETNSV